MTTPINGRPLLPSSAPLPSEQLAQHSQQLSYNYEQFTKPAVMGPAGWSRKLYRHLTNLIEGWMTQLLPRNTYDPKPIKTPQGLAGLKVSGLADRLAREFDPWNPLPNQDLVFLGLDQDYEQPVVSITIGGDTTPVNHENGQVIARYLNFGALRYIEGELNLADGSKIPLQVHIIKAL
ncbi:MAG: hypothetical protein WAQ53_08440 [Thiofilum sp.]|uniref:hypothetical protein n=1 Tax=Thiofilum sp. TaxID=2212733 RepID=UPI0025DE09C0|nr:hypothetical protein [Thiofilum sp.]MBK8452868.1 hypothetical protein [Thiofilum sp.]